MADSISTVDAPATGGTLTVNGKKVKRTDARIRAVLSKYAATKTCSFKRVSEEGTTFKVSVKSPLSKVTAKTLQDAGDKFGGTVSDDIDASAVGAVNDKATNKYVFKPGENGGVAICYTVGLVKDAELPDEVLKDLPK